MINNPECVACGSRRWEDLGRRMFRASDLERADEYTRKRLRVLFEAWIPRALEAEFAFVMCGDCGFVTFVPRPNEGELREKYRILAEQGDPGYNAAADDEGEDRRARALFRALAPFAGGSRTRILDYGGGNGRLLLPFARRGCDCCVVDYNDSPLPGIRRLASVLDEVPEGARFDLIVCSHVLEHLGDPASMLCRLGRHLQEGGFAYFEVPVEIWKGPPRMSEPVTHINFFTESTLRILLERCGFVARRSGTSRHPDLRRRMAVAHVVAQRNGASDSTDTGAGVEETRRLMSPSWAARLRRAFWYPDLIPGAVWRRMTR